MVPPSEGKTAPLSGPVLDVDALLAPELAELRSLIADALAAASSREDALRVLGVGARVADDVAAQRELWTLPCAPARQVYMGVLYAAMDLDSADDATLARADESVRIFSGLFGVLRPSDFIPAYRLSMGTTLPGLGNTSTLWRRALKHLDWGAGELVVDARSSGYQVWNPADSADHVVVGAARYRNGKRQVVSHFAKHYRGILAGALFRTATPPRDAEELAEFAGRIEDDVIVGVELDPPGKGPRKLTLITDN